MENEKIKVTVRDGNELREYEGNFIHLNVFNGTKMTGETCGSNYVPAAVADGAMDSVLTMIHGIRKSQEAEIKLLYIIGAKLMERMEEIENLTGEQTAAEK